MEVTIGFARADYEKLLHAVPYGDSAYALLRRPQQLDRWAHQKPLSLCVIVECESPEQAITLLEAARQHCPGAVSDILYALKQAAALHLIDTSP